MKLNNRRQFIKSSLIGSLYLVSAGSLISLSGCRKDNIQVARDPKDAEAYLSNLTRKSTDIFVFFIMDKVTTPVIMLKDFEIAATKQSVSLTSLTKGIIKTNFNPFDPIFNQLFIDNQYDTASGRKFSLKHREYPSRDFFAQYTKVINLKRFPDNKENVYVISENKLQHILSKFNITIHV